MPIGLLARHSLRRVTGANIVKRGMRAVLVTLCLAVSGCAMQAKVSTGGDQRKSSAEIADLSPRLLANPALARVLERAKERRVQVLLSRVVYDKRTGLRRLERAGYRLGAEYFYPASSIKLAAALAVFPAIEAMNSGYADGDKGGVVTIDSRLELLGLDAGGIGETADPSNTAGAITIRRELTKLFVESDNPAFNRLYEIIGHGPLNRTMHAMGFTSVVVNHRLSDPRAIANQQETGAVRLERLGGASPAYAVIPARVSKLTLANGAEEMLVGRAVMKGAGSKVKMIEGPMDFTFRNGVTLLDLQDMLVMLFAPDISSGVQAPASIRAAAPLLEHLSGLTPDDSGVPEYVRSGHGDSYCKFFLPGLERAEGGSQRWRVCNKIGQAYGFTIDNAWIVDRWSGEEWFLSAVIYTNDDGVLNDNAYEYAAVAEPFMAELAATLCVPRRNAKLTP